MTSSGKVTRERGGGPCPREGCGAQTSGPRRWCQAELPGTVCCARGRVPRPCRLPRPPREAGALAIPISQARRVRSRGQVTCLCSHDCPRVSASAIPWSSHRAGVWGGHTAPPAPWVTAGVEDTGPGPNRGVEQKRCAERRVTPGNEESLAGEKRTPGLSLRDPGDHRALTEQGGRATAALI